MTPALGFFYGGLVRAKNALNTMMMSYVALGFVGIAWAFIGYTFAFSTGSNWLGGLENAFFRGVGLEAKGSIPHILFAGYQATFCVITAALPNRTAAIIAGPSRGRSQRAEDGEQVAEGNKLRLQDIPFGLELFHQGRFAGAAFDIGRGQGQDPLAFFLDLPLDHGIHSQRLHELGSRIGEEGLMVFFRKGFTRGPIQAAIQRLREKDVEPHESLGKLDMTGWSGWCSHRDPLLFFVISFAG